MEFSIIAKSNDGTEKSVHFDYAIGNEFWPDYELLKQPLAEGSLEEFSKQSQNEKLALTKFLTEVIEPSMRNLIGACNPVYAAKWDNK